VKKIVLARAPRGHDVDLYFYL